MPTLNLTEPTKADTIVTGNIKPEQVSAVESFETYRSYLFSIAYRMLGSAMDAEDMVQETYLRYQAVPPESILSLKAYLTTIVTRLSIDQLQLAYRQRESYLGPWLPEPIITKGGKLPDAEEGMVMQESLSLAFLVMLEKLQPAERAVFLLREVFDYDYADIARFVGKQEAACRQLFSRAKKHLASSQPERRIPVEENQQLITGFIQAVREGNTTALMDLLAEDAVLVADGGGKIPGAAIHPILGRVKVAEFAMHVNLDFLPAGYRVELSEVNHQPAAIAWMGDRALVVMTIEAEAGRIKAVDFMANPDKLAHL